MSGGRLSKTEDGGGGSPVLHEESKAKKEGWGDRRVRPQCNEGLGLDSDGVLRPLTTTKRKPPAQQG